jgi:peptide-methionine (R)-S-oxide reductase
MRPVRLSAVTVARLFAAGRVAAGAAVLLRPEALARALRVDTSTARRTSWLARMFGIRDLALGAGTLFALTRGGQPLPWLLASAASDAVDTTALGSGLRSRQVGTVPAVLAGGLAAASVAVQLAAAPGRGVAGSGTDSAPAPSGAAPSGAAPSGAAPSGAGRHRRSARRSA